MDVQDAIKAAKDFARIVFADEDVAQLRTEEFEFDAERDAWLVTLGLMRPAIDTRAGQIATMLGNTAYKRSYRVFAVNDKSGQIESVKIKQFDE